MGADFCMAKFPMFNFSDDRKEQFRQVITSMTEDDQEYLRDVYYCVDDEPIGEIVEDMLETIKEASGYSSRETGEWNEYDGSGNRVRMLCTGGMSWGDIPTEAYAVLDKASHLRTVFDLAMKFSSEDIPK